MSIASEITRLDTAKANLKASINAKGGTLTNETIDQYYLAVDAIASGVPTDGTAVAGDILATKTAYSGNPSVKLTGTMINRGEVDTDITTKAQVVTIAQGYHNGSGTVQISSAEQAKIISGNIVEGVIILGQAGSAKAMTGLSVGNYLAAPPTASYNHTTELNTWTGKTIICEWQVSYSGDGGSAKLFEQSLTLNTSGKFIFYVVNSTTVRLTNSTSNITIASTSTQVTNIGGTTELTWNIYEA